MNILQKTQEHFFSITIFLLVILFVIASFYKFIIIHDYVVSYEGDCDPGESSCYVYCETDECDEPFYYTIIERDASHLYNLCGDDVTTCNEAYTCTDDDSCTIFFCESDVDGADACDTINTHGAYKHLYHTKYIMNDYMQTGSFNTQFLI